jgi:hypothetical protein
MEAALFVLVNSCGNRYNPLMAWCQFTHILSVPKGVIWLLLAATAEVPPTVGSACFSYPFFSSPPSASQVLLSLNLNGSSFLFPPYH